MGRPIGGPAAGLTTAQPPPGWYPDPWRVGQRRFWTGAAWTADTFADGPQDEGPPAGSEPPRWTYTTPDYGDTTQQLASPPQAPRSKRLVPTLALVVGAVVGFAVVASAVAVLTARSKSTRPTVAAQPPVAPRAPRAAPSAPTDPSAAALAGLVLRQADVASSVTVQTLPGGARVAGEATLDLCNGTYPSEGLRTSRLQVAAADAQGAIALSTEAVLYPSLGATTQAFAELRATAAQCPTTPVVSPVGEPTVTTQFKPAPDGSWPQTPTVERLAFDFVSTDQAGQTQRSIAVYLRRGRVLMGVYFSQPDGAQPAVNGAATIPAIANVFASRMAQLPASVVNN